VAGEQVAGPASERRQDWGEAPDVLRFAGRVHELATLGDWVLAERARLVAVLGMGGIGKTILVAQLAQEVMPAFERVYWRSLRNALPTGQWLAGAIGFLSDQELVPPEGEVKQLASLLQLLRDRPSLLVLDNFETLLEAGDPEGRYRDVFAGYRRLLQAIGEGRHQSCLVVTSREAPPELAVLSGGAVRTLQLGGLGIAEGQVLLADKQLSANPTDWANLISRFGGNGLALKVVGESIREVFGGDIGAFLDESGVGTIVGGIRRLLAEQIERSSALEQDLVTELAVEREPVTVAHLIADMGPRVARGDVLEAVEALRRRSLIEGVKTDGSAAFTLQSVVLEYVTDRLVEGVVNEIARRRPAQLIAQPLIKAQAKDYVRQMQERLIGEPVLRRLEGELGAAAAEQQLLALLEGWRNLPYAEQGYGPGNVVNLLRVLRGELRSVDLGRLAIRQVYLAEVEAQDASLVGAHLSEAILAEAFTFPFSVALSGDGTLLVAGTSEGEVWLWRVADRTPLLAVQGHTGAVYGLALSADGRKLASSSEDGTVRVWEAPSGRLLATLQGHTGTVWSVALSADARLLASGGFDGTVRLWDLRSASSAGQGVPGGRLLASLQGHVGTVWGVALSADGRLLASGGMDGTIRVWETHFGRPSAHDARLLGVLQGHTGAVWAVALSTDGRLLASGGLDRTVRLWETPFAQPTAHQGHPKQKADSGDSPVSPPGGGRLLATLQGHTGLIYGVALSADGRLLVSGSEDATVRLWEVPGGQLLAAFQGHIGPVYGVAMSADGRLLASGSEDATVRLWDAGSRRLLATLQGLTSGVWGVALSADGRLLASGSSDGTVRLWEATSGRLLAALQGHTRGVWGVALTPDGRLLASGGLDGTVRLWDASSARPGAPGGRLLGVFEGQTGAVWTVALSADGRLLASGGLDGTVRLWEASRGELLTTLQAHTIGVWVVALTPDGRLLASGSLDGTVRLWGVPGGQLVATMHGHAGPVYGVALSADGLLLASGGQDGTVRLWEATTGQPLATLQGHTGGVSGVALSADGRLMTSGGQDGTVRLWEATTGQPLATLHGHTGGVRGVAVSADGRLLASGGQDGTVRLWEASSAVSLRTLRSDRRYERLDITGLTGVTTAQRTALLALGAADRR
jgi:WD40 repeat protein